MKIAITGDVHLTEREKYPERYDALGNIVMQMNEKNISNLIIAGDLFDKDSNNYHEFEAFCNEDNCKDINFIIIPGNHDSQLQQKYFTNSNISIIESPEVKQFDESAIPILFLPYGNEESMGKWLAKEVPNIDKNSWILISHGDYMDGVKEPNPYEPGVYMPLTRKDIEQFKPSKVILGHIHKPMDRTVVYYTGSPSPLHINETGKRSFIVLETNDHQVSRHYVDSKIIYFDEVLTVIPSESEKEYVEEIIDTMIKNWDLSEDEITKVVLRLKIRGYINDKANLKTVVDGKLSELKMYRDEEVDLSEVSVSNDPERNEIVVKVLEYLDAELEWEDSDIDPSKEDIRVSALKTIFGA